MKEKFNNLPELAKALVCILCSIIGITIGAGMLFGPIWLAIVCDQLRYLLLLVIPFGTIVGLGIYTYIYQAEKETTSGLSDSKKETC